MHVQLSSDIAIDPQARHQIEHRLNTAFRRFAASIDRIELRLTDENGPRGGMDMQCQVIVAVRNVGSIVVSDTRVHLRAAVAYAVDRAVYAVARQLERKRTRKRRRLPMGGVNSASSDSDAPVDSVEAKPEL